jgi:hypothetical protein
VVILRGAVNPVHDFSRQQPANHEYELAFEEDKDGEAWYFNEHIQSA